MTRLAGRLAATLLILTTVSFAAAPAGAHDRWDREPRPPAIEYVVDEDSLPFDALPGFEDSRREWGVLGNAGWRIEVPDEWNGDLVMWAHGFRGTDTRLYFNPEEVPFREWLLAEVEATEGREAS